MNCPRLDLPAEPLGGGHSTTGSFALKNIKIKNSKTETIDNFDFTHKYFNLINYQECVTNSDLITRDSYRLKLTEVVKNSIEKYSFEYFENQLIPNRLSNSYDHWNRFKTNLSGVGNYDFVLDYSYTFLDGVNRNPDLESSQLGTLKKIAYPTKGYSEFIYGLNKTYGTYKLYNPPLTQGASIFLHGTEEIGIPNEEQHLTLPFVINKLPIDDYGNETKPTIRIYSPNIDVKTGFTTDNFYNFYIVNNANPSQNISFMFVGQNDPQTLNISNGSYTLHVIGKYEGLGAIINWIEEPTQVEVAKNMDIGGLRIEQIVNLSKENIVETKKIYKYNLNEDASKSSGLIINTPRYTYRENKYRVCSIVTAYHPSLGSTINNNSFLSYIYTTQQNKPYFPMNLLNGYHIMYPEVQIFDEENKQNGYSTFKYSFVNDDTRYSVNSGNYSSDSFICPPTSLDFLRGDLIEKIDYKKNNSKFIKVAESRYNYFHNELGAFFNDSNNNFRIGLKIEEFFKEKVIIRMAGGNDFPDTRFPSLFHLGYYKFQSVKKYLSKAIETIYDSNGINPVTTITDYKYINPLHNQLTSQITTSSSGDTTEIRYSYAHEIGNTEMISKNMIGIPLKTETFKNLEKLATEETIYKNWGNNLLAPEILKKAKGNQPLENKIKYNIVDNTNGNPLELQQESGAKIVYIWGYNQTLPIAKTENATYSSIPSSLITAAQTASNTGTEASLLIALNNLRNDTSLANAMVTTYTHKPLIGVSTITDPKGDKITYQYDEFNRLKFVKDKNGNLLSENEYHYKP